MSFLIKRLAGPYSSRTHWCCASKRALTLVLAVSLPAMLGACGSSGHGERVAEGPQASCGAAAPATLAKAAGHVAIEIYADELSGTGVRADQRQVESLRLHNRTVGHYLLSVQDDLGYVKLETRFLGLPLLLQRGALRIPLEGTLAAAPASIPNLGPVTYRGTRYEAFSFQAKAFPQGKVRISLFVPIYHSLASESCSAIKLSELAHVAQLVWHRYPPNAAASSTYVNQVGSLTGGLSYVRSATRQLAGSTLPGPTRLPSQGAVTYRGATWGVSSFSSPAPAGPVRVYVLVG